MSDWNDFYKNYLFRFSLAGLFESLVTKSISVNQSKPTRNFLRTENIEDTLDGMMNIIKRLKCSKL